MALNWQFDRCKNFHSIVETRKMMSTLIKLKHLWTKSALVVATVFYGQFAMAEKVAVEPKVAVVLDDSQGMCGYLSTDSAYKKSLIRLQRVIESTANLGSQGYLLSQIHSARPAVTMLERVVQSNGSRGSCTFRAQESQLNRFFDRSLNEHDAVILVTDLIFDQGHGSGMADGRTQFVGSAEAWSAKISKDKFFSTGFGLLALKSSFDGDYFSADGRSTVPQLKTEHRPYYVFWRTNGSSAGAKFINDFLQQSKPTGTDQRVIDANKANESLIFLPYPSKDWQFTARSRFPSFGESFSIGPQPFVTYDFQVKPAISLLEQVRPEQCFRWSGGILQFQDACGDGGRRIRGLTFSQLAAQSLQAAHIWFPIEDFPGTERNFVPVGSSAANATLTRNSLCSPAGVSVDRRSLCADVVQKRQHPSMSVFPGVVTNEIKYFAVLSILRSAPIVVRADFKQDKMSWRESFSPIPDFANRLFSTSAVNWNADREPCVAVSEAEKPACDLLATKTRGFELLISSLAGRLNANAKAISILNDKPDIQISFSRVRPPL
jgi:hypothetical protein